MHIRYGGRHKNKKHSTSPPVGLVRISNKPVLGFQESYRVWIFRLFLSCLEIGVVTYTFLPLYSQPPTYLSDCCNWLTEVKPPGLYTWKGLNKHVFTLFTLTLFFVDWKGWGVIMFPEKCSRPDNCPQTKEEHYAKTKKNKRERFLFL